MDNLEKADKILENLLDMAYEESNKANQKNYFSKDFAEACGIVLSMTYNRWKNDK